MQHCTQACQFGHQPNCQQKCGAGADKPRLIVTLKQLILGICFVYKQARAGLCKFRAVLICDKFSQFQWSDAEADSATAGHETGRAGEWFSPAAGADPEYCELFLICIELLRFKIEIQRSYAAK